MPLPGGGFLLHLRLQFARQRRSLVLLSGHLGRLGLLLSRALSLCTMLLHLLLAQSLQSCQHLGHPSLRPLDVCHNGVALGYVVGRVGEERRQPTPLARHCAPSPTMIAEKLPVCKMVLPQEATERCQREFNQKAADRSICYRLIA